MEKTLPLKLDGSTKKKLQVIADIYHESMTEFICDVIHTQYLEIDESSVEWRTVSKHDNYEISELGTVRKIGETELVDTIVLNDNSSIYMGIGNKRCGVRLNGMYTLVDDIMLDTFLESNKISNYKVLHLDRIVTNCRLDNLLYVSPLEYSAYYESQESYRPKFNCVAINNRQNVKYVASYRAKQLVSEGRWLYGTDLHNQSWKSISPKLSDSIILESSTLITFKKGKVAQKYTKVEPKADVRKGYKAIHNNEGQEKVVPPDKLQSYLDSGWELGYLRKTNTGRKQVNKDGVSKLVPKDEVDKYLADGWNLGLGYDRSGFIVIHNTETHVQKHIDPKDLNKYLLTGEWLKGSLPGRVHIHKDGEAKFIDESALKSYIQDGWELGRNISDKLESVNIVK